MKHTVLFAGSGEFGRAVLTELVENFDIVSVVTQPPRKSGKARTLQETPVCDLAKNLTLTVTTPDTDEQLYSIISSTQAEVVIVADYGRIIPQNILDTVPKGILNIHPSLLPKYRGPSPLQATILHGDTETGVTIMIMDSKMDHGPILAQEYLTLTGTETTPQLSTILAQLGATLLSKIVPPYLLGQVTPKAQDHSKATYCRLIKKEHGQILPDDTVGMIQRKIRALQPWPGLYLEQVVNNRPTKVKILEIGSEITNDTSNPGLLIVDSNKLLLTLSDGCVEVLTLQPEGKNIMSADAFIRGYRV